MADLEVGGWAESGVGMVLFSMYSRLVMMLELMRVVEA